MTTTTSLHQRAPTRAPMASRHCNSPGTRRVRPLRHSADAARRGCHGQAVGRSSAVRLSAMTGSSQGPEAEFIRDRSRGEAVGKELSPDSGRRGVAVRGCSREGKAFASSEGPRTFQEGKGAVGWLSTETTSGQSTRRTGNISSTSWTSSICSKSHWAGLPSHLPFARTKSGKVEAPACTPRADRVGQGVDKQGVARLRVAGPFLEPPPDHLRRARDRERSRGTFSSAPRLDVRGHRSEFPAQRSRPRP